MTLQEFEEKMRVNKVPDRLYSLNQGLKPDAYIRYKNYSKWECFYLDEKGNRNSYEEFTNEEGAYDFLWKKLEIEMKYPSSIPPKSVGI